MPAPQLTVHNAEIKTATVEIKTLTVSGKQVTLAVFRQLPEAELVSIDGSLNGTPWGTVNYHPDKCAESYGHIHVVWQRASELLRARVDYNKPLGYDLPSGSILWSALMRDYVQDGLHCPSARAMGRIANGYAGWWKEQHIYSEALDERISGYRVRIEPTPAAREVGIRAAGNHPDRAYGVVPMLEAEITAHGKSTDEIWQDIADEVQALPSRRARDVEIFRDLSGLPQLFIAV